MRKFDLTILRETRVYLGLALIPVGLLGSVVLGSEMGGFIFVIILIILYFFLIGYFALGHLTIILDNDELRFQWTKKYFFNFKEIDSVKLSDINSIIIDKGQFIRKIKTSNRTIYINNSKIKPKDAHKFLYNLSVATKNYNIQNMDSWDEWAEKGYLKIAYWVNTIILVAVGIIMLIAISRGVFTRHFFWVLFLLPQQFYLGQQMKQKLDK